MLCLLTSDNVILITIFFEHRPNYAQTLASQISSNSNADLLLSIATTVMELSLSRPTVTEIFQPSQPEIQFSTLSTLLRTKVHI